MVELMRLGDFLDISGVGRKESRMTQIFTLAAVFMEMVDLMEVGYKTLWWERKVVVNLSLEYLWPNG